MDIDSGFHTKFDEMKLHVILWLIIAVSSLLRNIYVLRVPLLSLLYVVLLSLLHNLIIGSI